MITVITGILKPIYVIHLVQAYTHTKHKLVSTWKDEDPNLLNILDKSGFIIVLSERPTHMTSYNAQAVTSTAGIMKAEQLGFTHVCRTRTDVFPTNHEYFLHCTHNLYVSKVMAICGIFDWFLDIIMIGPTSEMIKAFSHLQLPNDDRCPEHIIMDNLYDRTCNEKEEKRSILNFCLPICKEKGLEIIWYRPLPWKNSVRSIPYMKIVNEYCIDGQDPIWA